MPTKRRHHSEFGIVVPLDRTLLLEPRALHDPAVLERIREDADTFHLYLVGERLKTCVVPGSVRIDGDLIGAHFVNRVNSEETTIWCTWTMPEVVPGARADSVWPHNVVRVFDRDDRLVLRRNASFLLAQAMMSGSFDDAFRAFVDEYFLDMNVLYVGKSFGRSQRRGALTRLRSHSTLQRIITELPGERELWLLLVDSSTYTLLTSIMPPVRRGDPDDRADDEHIRRALRGPISDELLTDLVEGCLIRYFQPRYNTQLLTTFPSPTARPLTDVYDRDFNLVGVTLDTSHLGWRLGTATVPFSYEHDPAFALHPSADRAHMFELPAIDGTGAEDADNLV